MSKKIGLLLPERNKPSKGDFDIRPKAVEQWIDSLPRASVGNCAKQVYHALHEINHLDIRFQDRMRVLESFREPVQYVNQAMQRHFVGSVFPLPVKNQKIAAASRELYLLMAVGYQIAMEDMLGGNVLFVDKRKLTSLIHRSITYLSRALLVTYQIYAPLPKNIWLRLNKLYAYAEQHKLQQITVADNQHQYIKKTSIADEYIRVMLLSLASPYHLRNGEVAKLYVNLERWMGYAALHRIVSVENIRGEFLVNLDADEAPVHLQMGSIETDSPGLRILDTSALLEVLYAELQKSEDLFATTLITANLAKETLSHELLRGLSTSWGAITKRAFARKDVYAKVNVTIGLTATHQAILNYEHAHAEFDDAVAAEDSRILRVVNSQSLYHSKDVEHVKDDQPDVWEMVYDHGRLQMVSAQQKPGVVASEPESKQDLSCGLKDWTLINQSEAGYCICCQSDCGTNLQVGEVVGLRPEQAGPAAYWTVGVIRWMQADGKLGIRVGGQLLGRAAIPVGISAAINGNKNEQVQRALLLPAAKSIGRSSRLLTLGATFRPGAIVLIYLSTGTIRIKLTQEYERVGLYFEFEYEELNDAEVLQRNTLSDSSGEYDDVWSCV